MCKWSDKNDAPDLYSETFGGANDADREHGHRLSRYAKARRCVDAVLNHIKHDEELRKEYEAIWWCGRKLIFRLFLESRAYRLIGGCSCKKHLLCCLCALRRAARQSKEYELRIRQLLKEHPDWQPVLITRTVKNGHDLWERYRHFTKAHKRLMHNRRQSIGKSRTAGGYATRSVMRLIHGGAGSLELKLGKGSGAWHPHSHEIALLDGSVEFTRVFRKGKWVDAPLEFEELLSREWFRATGDSFIVDVRRLDIDDEERFRKGVCEAFKYALKFSDMEPVEQAYAYKVLKGKRLIYSYGALWGVKVSDSTVDTVEEALELEPYVDLIYTYSFGRYILSETTDMGELEKKRKYSRSSRKREPFVIHFDDGSVIDLETVEKFIAEREEAGRSEKVPF